MIQKHINLFVEPSKNSRRGIEYLHKIRAVALVISMLSFISLLVVFVFQATLASRTSVADKEKELLEKEIIIQLEKQLTSHLVGMRLDVIESALTQDVEFASTEARIKRIFNDFDVETKVTNIAISSKNKFSLTLKFPNEQELLYFVKVSENPEFAENFLLLEVSDFSVSKASTQSASIDNTIMTVTGELL